MSLTNLADQNISFTLTFEPPAPQPRQFDRILLTEDLQGYDETTDDKTIKVQAGDDLSSLSVTPSLETITIEAIKSAFAQNPKSSTVIVSRYDSSGSGSTPTSMSDAFNQALDEGRSFYGVVPDDPSSAASLLGTIESADGNYLMVAHDDDSAWNDADTDPPSQYSSYTNTRRGVVVYHTDARYNDVDNNDEPTNFAGMAVASRNLAFAPSDQSAPWTGPVSAQYPYDSSATINLDNIKGAGANVLLPYGPVSNYHDPAQTIGTTPIYETVSTDWFVDRAQNDVAQVKLNYDAQGEKLPITSPGEGPAAGVEAVVSAVNRVIADGQNLGHFSNASTDSQGNPINEVVSFSSDVDTQTVTLNPVIQFQTSGRIFDINLNFIR